MGSERCFLGEGGAKGVFWRAPEGKGVFCGELPKGRVFSVGGSRSEGCFLVRSSRREGCFLEEAPEAKGVFWGRPQKRRVFSGRLQKRRVFSGRLQKRRVFSGRGPEAKGVFWGRRGRGRQKRRVFSGEARSEGCFLEGRGQKRRVFSGSGPEGCFREAAPKGVFWGERGERRVFSGGSRRFFGAPKGVFGAQKGGGEEGREGGRRVVGAPEGWWEERRVVWGPEGWGGPEVGDPNDFVLFCPLSPLFSFCSSLGGRFVEFWWCFESRGPQMCTFGILVLSCEAQAAGLSVNGVQCRGQILDAPTKILNTHRTDTHTPMWCGRKVVRAKSGQKNKKSQKSKKSTVKSKSGEIFFFC